MTHKFQEFSFFKPILNYVEITTKHIWGLPWWRSGWESACQCRGHGFVPWSGKIPHAAEQLSPCATTTEPAHLDPVLRNKRGHDSERPSHHDEEWSPLAATRESPRAETRTQHSSVKGHSWFLRVFLENFLPLVDFKIGENISIISIWIELVINFLSKPHVCTGG